MKTLILTLALASQASVLDGVGDGPLTGRSDNLVCAAVLTQMTTEHEKAKRWSKFRETAAARDVYYMLYAAETSKENAAHAVTNNVRHFRGSWYRPDLQGHYTWSREAIAARCIERGQS